MTEAQQLELILKAVDHCEMDHEFEIAPMNPEWSLGRQYVEVLRLHDLRHVFGDHWNHTHDKNGTVIYKEGM